MVTRMFIIRPLVLFVVTVAINPAFLSNTNTAAAFTVFSSTNTPFAQDGVVLHAVKKQKKKKGGKSVGSGAGFGGGGDSSSSSRKNNSTGSTKKKTTGFGDTAVAVTAPPDAQAYLDLASGGVLGRVVDRCRRRRHHDDVDPFWEIIPALIGSRFPTVTDAELTRIAGVLGHTLDPDGHPLDDDIVHDPYRPHGDVHAYMPGLGPTRPFYEPSELRLCDLLHAHYDTICQEYQALLNDNDERDRFQSVTSMNYKTGWKTLVLFYNGHRIPDFPYHLCPVTTQILETVPLAGRIAGFNRQRPNTGIPLHSDGNNMWLTCQMGVHVPKGNKAWIRVGPETRHWSESECLVYDTTYEHETMNESLDEERVVLHVDFFNILAMTEIEIDIMQYIYEMRETFMKAEGVAKVGSQIL